MHTENFFLNEEGNKFNCRNGR